MTPSKTYLAMLLFYCEDEIMGEAYFYAIAKQFDDPDRALKMQLMAQVERHAVMRVPPFTGSRIVTTHGRTIARPRCR